MRDKFSELIERGVAGFKHTPLAEETPGTDPVSRSYNNIFGVATDTRMSVAGDGCRYITGRLIGDEYKLNQFSYASVYGGVNFSHSGFWSFNDFLYKNGLCYEKCILNGDVVLKITERVPNDEEYRCPQCCVACESNINIPFQTIVTDRNPNRVEACFRGNIENVVKNLNESQYIKGNNWVIANEQIIGLVDNKVIRL